jgi:cell division protein FtsW (lipid II flippase)
MEEVGFVALLILCFYLFLTLSIGKNILYVLQNRSVNRFTMDEDREDLYVSSHINVVSIVLIISEVTIHTSVSMGFIPTKGMALPFVSYGGSSLVSHFILIGLNLYYSANKYYLCK